jgi:hypothetical protein
MLIQTVLSNIDGSVTTTKLIHRCTSVPENAVHRMRRIPPVVEARPTQAEHPRLRGMEALDGRLCSSVPTSPTPLSMLTKLRAVVFTILATCAGVSHAVPVRYEYSGVVTELRDYLGTTHIADYAALGQRFYGSFYYDADAPFQYFIEPGRALFRGPFDPSTVSIGGLTVEGHSAEVQLFDEYPGYPENVFLPSVDNDLSDLPSSLHGYAAVIRLNFVGAIDAMTLPQTLNLADFPFPWFSITGYSADGQAPGYFAWGVHGYVDTLVAQTVPEPNSLALGLLGLAGVMSWRRRARRS